MIELLQYRTWALAESYFRMIAPRVIESIAKGDTLITKKTQADYEVRIEALLSAQAEEEIQVNYTRDAQSGFPVAKVGSKNIMIMSVIGPLSKYGDMCSLGMQDYTKIINMMNSNADLHGMVMVLDSPGGTVDGTPEFGMAVANSPKPIGVFGDNMVASAALWVASQAAVIVGNKNNPTDFGSIGTLMVTEDYTAMMEAGRFPKMKIHRAPQSTEKALVNPLEPITEEIQSNIDASLKEITDLFIGTVKKGRGEKLNTKLSGLFKGKMFDAATSKNNGLIDAVGTLQTTINKVAEIARNGSRSTNNQQPTTSTEPLKIEEEFMFDNKAKEQLQAEQAEHANTKASLVEVQQSLAAEQEKLQQAITEKAALEARISTLDATVTEHATVVAAKEAEITQLKEALAKAPAAAVTTVISNEEQEAQVAADGQVSATQKGKYRTPTDDEADAYLQAIQTKNQ